MIKVRPGDVVLSHEEAARFDEDQRENLRSWGIGVPEPVPSDPTDEEPIKPTFIPLWNKPPHSSQIIQTYNTATAMQNSYQNPYQQETIYIGSGMVDVVLGDIVPKDWRIK